MLFVYRLLCTLSKTNFPAMGLIKYKVMLQNLYYFCILFSSVIIHDS